MRRQSRPSASFLRHHSQTCPALQDPRERGGRPDRCRPRQQVSDACERLAWHRDFLSATTCVRHLHRLTCLTEEAASYRGAGRGDARHRALHALGLPLPPEQQQRPHRPGRERLPQDYRRSTIFCLRGGCKYVSMPH